MFGSQAILGTYPNAPDSLLVSIEADISPLDTPEKADIIDACIGELSLFHETFGYYAHGITPEAAILPINWKKRLVRIESQGTAGILGWCLSPPDVAVSKLMAGREKDMAYVQVLLTTRLVEKHSIQTLEKELTEEHKTILQKRLLKCVSGQF